ncbi:MULTISPECIES: TlyA family RNA methyltransferase [Actinoalloteichus]|uniref:Hemolysin A n=1 Tax=Actinoalloteichus fjordicus TaxID=1612552 RepID=A0AAC9LGA9_9PSEU|nr:MULTISPECIES: TlyA family RNA methyltransferase [Actinoalloteichus]APU16335.1 hemolysin A [Actinoalloteichus fjordicus]APU22394.1 hemolysin A [Actinoalloteichus sp. GBA129-24]
MTRRVRLDAELVRRGLARSREQAVELVNAGRVVVRGMVARKPATAVETDAPVLVQSDEDDQGWASRGAHKLIGALDAFEPAGLSVAGRRCLDAGASTGGFTDVLLRRDAAEVVAADVGYGQLVWRLQTDGRVRVLDRTNVRALDADVIGGQVALIVADLSFISLRLVLPALASCAAPGADLLPMVKPQFEVGRGRLGAGGVVRDPEVRVDAVLEVIRVAERHDLSFRGVVASPLPGPAGNVEYFLWLTRGHAVAGEPASPAPVSSADRTAAQTVAPGNPVDVEQAVRDAVREGPR